MKVWYLYFFFSEGRREGHSRQLTGAKIISYSFSVYYIGLLIIKVPSSLTGWLVGSLDFAVMALAQKWVPPRDSPPSNNFVLDLVEALFSRLSVSHNQNVAVRAF